MKYFVLKRLRLAKKKVVQARFSCMATLITTAVLQNKNCSDLLQALQNQVTSTRKQWAAWRGVQLEALSRGKMNNNCY